MKRRIEFSDADVHLLHHERFHHPHARVRRKMEVLWLKSQGLSHQQIMHLTRVSANTLRNYLREYAEGGMERIRELRVHRPQSALRHHQEALQTYFRTYPPQSVQEAMAKIEELTGIKRRPTQTRHFLRMLGVGFRQEVPVACRRAVGRTDSGHRGACGSDILVEREKAS